MEKSLVISKKMINFADNNNISRLKQMKLKQIISAILVATVLQSVEAQQLKATRQHYTTEDGLCSNIVTALQQDGYGYIWIGARNGLSRYDGYHFYNYRTGNGSGVKNLHNHTLGMVIDLSQNVWIRMYDHRVFVLDRSIDKIIDPFENSKGEGGFFCSTPLIVTTTGDVLANIKGRDVYKLRLDRRGLSREVIATSEDGITCMGEDREEGIWLGTPKGLRHIGKEGFNPDEAPLLADEHITSIFGSNAHVIVATHDGKIFSISPTLAPKQVRKAAGRPIYSVFEDSKNIIWFCDNTMGALCLNPETGREKRFQQVVPVPEPDERGGVFREVDGRVWMSMNYGGYGYYNRETDQVEYFHNDPSNPWNLLNTVQTSLELPEGVVFESTKRRGLEKLEIQKDNIIRKKLLPDAATGIDNEIRAIYYDKSRKLLLMGNKNSMLFLMYDNGQKTVITKDSDGNPFGRFYGISKDSKGNYWMCSKDKGVYIMSPNGAGSWTIRHYSHDDSDPKSLSHNGAYMTLEDKDGNIWIATYGGGVNLLTKAQLEHIAQGGKPEFLNLNNGMADYPKNTFMRVRVLETDSTGLIWAGTTEGLLLLSYQNSHVNVEQLKMSDKVEEMLQNNDIVCMKRAPSGEMWIGTNGGIAHCTDKKDGVYKFASYGPKNGLPFEEIHSLTYDMKGNPWFGAEYSICSVDRNVGVITGYGNLDGVSETELSEGAAITLPNGQMIFGTVDGYYIVDMEKLRTSSGSQLKLQITDFLINTEIQSPRLNDTYDYYVPLSRSVKLPHRDTQFAFRFASLNYQLQHRVHYQYMLEGYDKDWQNADKSRMARYSNLPGGTYVFKVKAYLLESPDKYDIRTMEVIVPSIFHLPTTIITIICVVMILILLTASIFIWKKKERTNS